MPLLVKDGKLASIGGALKRFVAGCIDKCCGKWYCHIGYYCDQDEAGHISEHSSEKECFAACQEPPVTHYCHSDGGCDEDPTDAVATYPSQQACEDACDKWWCCWESSDYTKGSTCQQGPCGSSTVDSSGDLTRSGPFEDQKECEPECESQYYCVLVTGPTGGEYQCLIDPSVGNQLSGPYSLTECQAVCVEQTPYVWCVDRQRCVQSYDGPPDECNSLPCTQYDNFIDCGLDCLEEQWYCVLPGECLQLQTPPAANPTPYNSEKACLAECQQYYCCYLSEDYTKGSKCQMGECDENLYRSGPYDDDGYCEVACHQIFCWSYYDVPLGETVKVCQEDAPICPDPPGDCEIESVVKESGPYGPESDCNRICNAAVYKWYCKDYVCTECCESGVCLPDDESCPASGVYDTEQNCKDSCKPLFWECTNKECVEIFTGEGSYETFEECFPMCCDDACIVPAGTCNAGDTEGWATLTRPTCEATDELGSCVSGIGEALSAAGWNVEVDNGDKLQIPNRTKGCCDCDGKNNTSVFACCEGEVGAEAFYVPRGTTEAPCDGEWAFDANGVISLGNDEEGNPAFKLYPCLAPPPCPPESCTVTLYAATTETDRPPYYTTENIDKALKITVECKLVNAFGGFNYSGSIVPPGASHPVYASVSVTRNGWEANANMNGGGQTSATQLNLPIPEAQQIVPYGEIPNIAFFNFDGRSEQIGPTPDDTLPNPAMTPENVCNGITTYKMPAYRYPESGPLGLIWAGYKWFGSLEYFPLFAGSDGYDGAPLTYLEVEFKPQNKASTPAPPSVLVLAP
jgi:hypothetical protein